MTLASPRGALRKWRHDFRPLPPADNLCSFESISTEATELVPPKHSSPSCAPISIPSSCGNLGTLILRRIPTLPQQETTRSHELTRRLARGLRALPSRSSRPANALF